ncbi:RNA polymerase sigma factor [Streptomyces sp. PLK6-54]|uniref:RNA polymerase sigma factor n=1 Tax=Actinacidiphila acidipaludis TaxID=2873382 RepID=A0ABS7Q8Q8_9ACTN|nr:RNA polymerase sigma factor [Streptomyces acidipaludis]MBY8879545.1 RNA polymerase sigma factor [Streptomyces acidipaludis]
MRPSPADPPAPHAAPETLDDAQLIGRSLDEPEVFAELYHRHAGELLRYVARRLGPALADDVVGETFLIAFRRRTRYDRTRTKALPWLYGIAANVMSQHRRSELRAYRALARTGVDPVAQSTGSDADSVDGKVTAQASAPAIAAALRSLSEGDRHVLLLFAWADLSYEEVAEALGIPLGTVRSRLNRARRKMRAALPDLDPIPTPETSRHG